MQEPLQIEISPEIFKLKDPRVDKLRAAKLSVKTFSLLLRPEDPYVLIGHIIYPYTEKEYYALQATTPMTVNHDAAFSAVMAADPSIFSASDRARIEEIKSYLPGCPVCRRNKYRDELYRMAKRYGIQVSSAPMAPVRAYPETTEPVAPLVFALTDHMYSVPKETRKSCMDCVEKHLAQAWVLSGEFYQGYPEHLTYVIGHICEALDELPKELTALKDTLEFCLARMGAFREPFVPLGALMGHIERGRMDMKQAKDDALPDTLDDLSLELDSTMESELLNMPDDVKDKFKALLETLDFPLGVENSNKMKWKGTMAVAADLICPVAPNAANMLRRRRLVFGEAPHLAAEAGYSADGFLALLREGARPQQNREDQIANDKG